MSQELKYPVYVMSARRGSVGDEGHAGGLGGSGGPGRPEEQGSD